MIEAFTSVNGRVYPYQWAPYTVDEVNRRSTANDRMSEFVMAIREKRILFRPHFVETTKAWEKGLTAQGRSVWAPKRSPGSPRTTRYASLRHRVASVDRALSRARELERDTRAHLRYTDDQLLTKAIAEENEREFDILTAIGELPETLAMFMDLLKALKNPLQSLKKASKKDLLTQGSQAWLTYRYGVMPLVYQAQEIIDLLNKQTDTWSNTRVSERTSKSDRFDLTHSFISSDAPLCKELITITCESKHSALVRRCYSIEQLKAKRLAINPVATGWELIPFSFVIDWFVQVGDLISALTPTEFTQQAWTVSFRLDVKVNSFALLIPRETYDGIDYHYSYPVDKSGADQVFHYRKSSYNRIVGTEHLSHISIPIGVKLNLKRQLDAFGLLWLTTRSYLKDINHGKFRPPKR